MGQTPSSEGRGTGRRQPPCLETGQVPETSRSVWEKSHHHPFDYRFAYFVSSAGLCGTQYRIRLPAPRLRPAIIEHPINASSPAPLKVLPPGQPRLPSREPTLLPFLRRKSGVTPEVGRGTEENKNDHIYSAIFLPLKINPYLEMFAAPSQTRQVTSGPEK